MGALLEWAHNDEAPYSSGVTLSKVSSSFLELDESLHNSVMSFRIAFDIETKLPLQCLTWRQDDETRAVSDSDSPRLFRSINL